jgi:hypothetical protein
LYEEDKKIRKGALHEISKNMFKDIIIKIEDQNKSKLLFEGVNGIGKNLPLGTTRISDEKQQLRYIRMNNRLYEVVKVNMIDKTKNILLKYSNNKHTTDKVEETRKKMEADY